MYPIRQEVKQESDASLQQSDELENLEVYAFAANGYEVVPEFLPYGDVEMSLKFGYKYLRQTDRSVARQGISFGACLGSTELYPCRSMKEVLLALRSDLSRRRRR